MINATARGEVCRSCEIKVHQKKDKIKATDKQRIHEKRGKIRSIRYMSGGI